MTLGHQGYQRTELLVAGRPGIDELAYRADLAIIELAAQGLRGKTLGHADRHVFALGEQIAELDDVFEGTVDVGMVERSVRIDRGSVTLGEVLPDEVVVLERETE